MKTLFGLCLVATALSQQVDVWLSTGDSLKKLVNEAPIAASPGPVGGTDINVDRAQVGQTITGFGAALSNAASSLIYNHPQRSDVLRRLFDPSTGVGLSFVRLVMGGSDFNAVDPYTYDDMPPGQEDFNMDFFSIDADRDFVLPLLQEIVTNYPDVSVMASPWSPPAWMKGNENLFGGSLKTGSQYLAALADYFVEFIEAYAAEGVTIDMVSLQNEPEHGVNDYPTMLMSWQEQRDLIRDHVGPKFSEAGITTKVQLLDHNWDLTDYVLNILRDVDTYPYVAGSAWHCYAGNKDDPSIVASEFPEKELHFTECTGGEWDTHFGSSLGWNAQNLFIGQTRIGSKSVLLWNMALDENFGPRQGVTGGCQDCRGVLTLPSDNSVIENVEYYTLGHWAKFVRPGATLIYSDTYPSQELETAAYQNPDGSVVVEILNAGWDATTQTFQVILDGNYYYYEELPSRSLITFVLP